MGRKPNRYHFKTGNLQKKLDDHGLGRIKQYAHELLLEVFCTCDPKCTKFKCKNRRRWVKAYAWIRAHCSAYHIGEMDLTQLMHLINALEYKKKFGHCELHRKDSDFQQLLALNQDETDIL